MNRRQMVTVLMSGVSDTTAPTVAITCAQTSPTAVTPLNFTFTLSEVSTDFAIGDITVGNGTASNFAGSGTSYTCDVTPTVFGAITVDVAANSFHDVAGNGNVAATQFSITHDLAVYTDADNTSTFDPAWTFAAGGGPMTVDWGDGSAPESHASGLSHTYGAGSGRHRAVFTCPDWTKVTFFDVNADVCRLAPPDLGPMTNLLHVYFYNNQFTSVVDMSRNTKLVTYQGYGNGQTGTLPSFNACTDLATWQIYDHHFVDASMPTFAACTKLVTWSCGGTTSYNGFSGTLPSFNTCIELVTWKCYDNRFTGSLPTFAACTKLVTFLAQSNFFSGTLPNFATCTKLVTFTAYQNNFSGYTAGSFATQKDMTSLRLDTNNLPQAAIDNILADLVVSLGVVGRVACAVDLSGGGNAMPSAAGLADVATLRAAGWTVTYQLHTLLTPCPIEADQMGFETLGSLIYYVGGRQTTPNIHSAKTYSYNPATDTWTQLADIPNADGLQSPILRAVGTKLYCIGGYNSQIVPGNVGNGGQIYNTVYEYDPGTNAWVTKTPKPTPVEDFGSAVISDKIYCYGGLTIGTSEVPVKVLEIYDPATDTWDATKADMPAVKWSGDFGEAYNGKAYAISSAVSFVGYPNLTAVNTVYEYDPVGNAWATKAVATVPTCYKEVVALGTKLYVVSGSYTNTATYSATIYSFDPAGNSWAAEVVPPYTTGGAGLAVYDGNIYMVGGIGYADGIGNTTIKLAHLYKLNLA